MEKGEKLLAKARETGRGQAVSKWSVARKFK